MSTYNPFSRQIMVDSRSIYLDSLFFEATDNSANRVTDKYSLETIFIDGPIDFNPTILTKSGELVGYQRPYVWTDEDRFRLLDTIYRNGNIGTFLFAENARFRLGKGTRYHDIIDGKQRLTTLIYFAANQFPDRNGQYYKDFSQEAELRFRNFSNFAFQCLRYRDYTPETVKELFLATNTLGVAQSVEHIQTVKSLDV
jgi:hypothetical protein